MALSALKTQIQDSLVTSVSERLFLPTDKLHEILTQESIRNAVKELLCGPEHCIKLAETIYNEGKRVFAMLIYNDWQDHIIAFRKYGALDSRLPLSEDDAVSIAGRDVGRRLARDTQWVFCPYTFPKNMWECDCQVERKMILPFISAEQIGSGAFSIVEKISISPSQQNFTAQGMGTVLAVRKRLNVKGSTQDFDREVRCLRLLNQLRHPNIISLWGSYTYREEQNFLFPYIDMDLGKFLLAKTRHQEFQWDFTFYSALAGLASALSKTHRLILDQVNHDVDFDAIGYHHDLRPPNVLVCANTFILADFGLGKFKRVEELSHTPYKSISGDYIAPECTDMEERPLTVNRAIDVWAFGCLMAEVVTYMLKGEQGIGEFRKKRLTSGRFPQWKDASFYQPHGAVKHEVINWMETLRNEYPCPDLAPHLIEISLDALQPNPQLRPDMNTIHRRLANLSMQKHFQSVSDMFHKIQGTEPVSTPLAQHHLESLQFAQKRFEVWGDVLALREDHISTQVCESSDTYARIMTSLLHALREESQERMSKDSSSLVSLPRLIVHKVEDLWTALPNDMLQLANNYWKEEIGKTGLAEQLPSPRNITHLDVPTARSASPTNILRSEFEEAARLFKDDLLNSIPFSEISKVTSVSDFYDITDKLQADQHMCGGLRNLSKIQLYLERLGGFIDVIGNIIHGNGEVLTILWGTLAFLLQLAGTLDEAYDSLVNAVAEIGQILPDFRASVSILNRNKETGEITVLFFKDILSFYRELLQPFTHPNWMHVFVSLWPKNYNSILEVARHIGRLTRLMRTEISLEHIQQEYEFRNHAMDSFKTQAAETRRQEFQRIKTSFNPCGYDETLYRLDNLRCQQTGDWLFRSRIFLDWIEDSQGEARKILWLKGIPGAGKTVLSSAIVEYLGCIKGAKTAFAFFTYQEAKTSALSIIHSLIFQLAGRDEGLMAIICESMCDDLKRKLTTAGDLLASLAHYVGPVYFVLDGADEISETERGRLVTELLRLAEANEELRIIFSARPEADLMRLLDKTAVAINVHDENEANIKNYVDQRTKYIFHKRQVYPKAQDVIIQLLEPLVRRAKGMFLYARLIMDLVANLHDLSEIQRELTVLPESLDDAYHRIIMRLVEHKDKRRATEAQRLLGWIACTPTPITIHEAHQALLVRPDDRDQVFNIVSKLDVVEILGPIVETVDTYIRFVHFTAKEYISSPHLGPQLIDITQATMDLAVQCIGYLCQHRYGSDLTEDEIRQNVCTGQYAFHAFSTRMWFELVCQYLQAIKTGDSLNELIHFIQMLLEARKIGDTYIAVEDGHINESEVENESEPSFDILKVKQPQVYQLLCKISLFRRRSFIFTGMTNNDTTKNNDDPTSISDTSRRIRQAFDDVLCKSLTHWTGSGTPCHEHCADILQYYGPRPFKCKFPQCEFWQHGFQERASRDKHEISHDSPLKCPFPGCEFGVVGFLSEKLRKDHTSKAHQNNSSDLSLGIQNVTQDEGETILLGLIKENQVETIKKILFAFPAILEHHKIDLRRKLQVFAAFQASSCILDLLGGPGDYVRTRDMGNHWRECVTKSIESRNISTLRCLLAKVNLWEAGLRRSGNFDLIAEFVSGDWDEGTKLFARELQRSLPKARRKGAPRVVTKGIFGSKIYIQKAASHKNGHQQLLILWKESGISRYRGPEWAKKYASPGLRYVAQYSHCLDLAAFLLQEGADVNWRISPKFRTALQLAAQSTSAEAAEMVRFLLLNGADPGADKLPHGNNPAVKISEEDGAKGIHKWLGKTWDELVEETERELKRRETAKISFSRIG
ncbi:hypothetical protein F4803DRAFT_519717 [Xylaria telfairii]|nr:hypothetical protein F4803DRAFT_519717 [Xylaria telfairii]